MGDTATAALAGPVSTTVRGPLLVSADSHGGAPDALVRDRLPETEREKLAPPVRVEDLPEKIRRRYKNASKKEPELLPDDRVKDLEMDGVYAEVIYGTTGFYGQDFSFELDRIRASNDAMAALYEGWMHRFAPAAAMPLPIAPPYGQEQPLITPTAEHVKAAIEELRRCHAMGLRPAMLPDHSDGLSYNSSEWYPLWEAACETGMPLAFHSGFGRQNVRTRGPGSPMTNYTLVTTSMVETLAHLTCGGVLERFPDLRVVLVECGIGWLAYAMQVMDESHVKHAVRREWSLQQPPSEYVKRQVKLTFQEDPVGLALRHFTGLDCLMWGSDYPHHEGTWPRSLEAIAEQFAGIPDAEVDKIVCTNAADLFGFDVPAELARR
jgi:predicted TIM-barrel fold metal-dependent hydrolase